MPSQKQVGEQRRKKGIRALFFKSPKCRMDQSQARKTPFLKIQNPLENNSKILNEQLL